MEQWEGSGRFGRLQEHIEGEWLRAVARQDGDRQRWTRNRKMPLADMVRCTLQKKGLSATMEIRQYFQEAENMERIVSKQGYLRQRQQLNPKVFKLLNQKYLQDFYAGTEAECWHGMIVLAIDGSRVEISNSAENREKYGESGGPLVRNQYGKAVARANFSGAYDVYNRFFVDIGIHHFTSSEITEAEAHIPAIREVVGDRPVLVICDRNYGALEYMAYLEKAGIKYLIRLKNWNYQREREGIQGDDGEVVIACTKNRMRRLKKEAPERAKELEAQGEIRARILTMKFGGEEEGALITNLPCGEYGAAEIRRMYRKRWLLEQKYHTLKNKMKFESVTGNASVYVEQDMWAQALVFNMTQDLITGAEWHLKQKIKKKKKPYRHEMRINENIAIGLYKEQFIRLILEEDPKRKDEMFIQLKEEMTCNIVPVRVLPNKHRKWNYFNKYKCNQKPSF